jgi:hypothetical protein
MKQCPLLRGASTKLDGDDGRKANRGARELWAAHSNLNVFGEGQSVFNVDAEITHSAFNFGMTQQNLHRAQVSRLFVDQSRLI